MIYDQYDIYNLIEEETNKSLFLNSFKIIEDEELGWCVDINGIVNYEYLNITNISIPFRKVTGQFIIWSCPNLISFYNCPKHINGNFTTCLCPLIKTIEYLPKYITYNLSLLGNGFKPNIEQILSNTDYIGKLVI